MNTETTGQSVAGETGSQTSGTGTGQETQKNSLEDKVASMKRTVAERYRRAEKAACDCVVQRPGTSIATVATAGLLLGVLIGRRSLRYR